MTRLCLIRHGQTDWNIEGRYQGQSDVPLNQAGCLQANGLAGRLQGQSFAAVYSSDLIRAKKTAEVIAASFHLPVVIDHRLREINQGEWEGQHVEAIKARYLQLWQQRAMDPASFRPPGGETVQEVSTRVYLALDEITGIYRSGTVLIVSHGLALATAICKVNRIPIGQVFQMIPENADPVWVEWHKQT